LALWTRRQALTAALGGAATALLPSTDVGRPGEEWIAEAQSIERHAERWGPTATLANAGRLLARLDVALVRTPRQHDRLPLHVAAAIAGTLAARVARWEGNDPSERLSAALEHAEAAHDGPAKAQVLDQHAAVLSATARITGLPSAQETELATRALWEAGSSTSCSEVRAAARWRLAWERAATGDHRGALVEADAALRDVQRAGRSPYGELHTTYGEILLRCGRLSAAQEHLTRALSAPPVRRIVVLTNLALCHARSGEAEAAATSLEEAVHLVQACRAPGRLAGIRAVRALLPPGPHREQLDDVLRG
jgi:tetratricopeptide (TPR) repeat protein